MDESLAEWALAQLYDDLGQRRPPVVWVDSPGEAARAIGDAGARELVTAPYGGVSMCGPVEAMPGDELLIDALGWILAEHVDESALERVAAELGLLLVDWYAPPVECSHGWSVESPLSRALRTLLHSRPEVPKGWYAAWSAAQWVGFYDVLRESGLLTGASHLNRELDVLFGLARSGCGWWWPYRDLCVVSRRPVAMATEDLPRPYSQTRLHCADGPALTFADGWACHVWHGVDVPGDLVEEGWSVDRILAEPDRRIRRCAVERMGWPEFLDAAGLTPKHVPVADPAVPGGALTLYETPESLLGHAATVLVFTDDRGRRRGQELLLRADEPVEGAAQVLHLTREQYLTVNLTTGSEPTRTPAPRIGRPATVPVRSVPQRRGAVAVVPVGLVGHDSSDAGTGSMVPEEGVVVFGDHAEDSCLLRADGSVAWDPLSRGVGVFTVAPDAVAYLEQPGHVPLACAPGAYLLRLV
ncbi:DUF6745 domain-containing protein [Streptomyces sp. NPDC005476]|uniref:DUF6745 domain-containing protein n=1 Tax=Streptomyces sp. NPDC005476 TaxID=3156882 RepID=UPI003451D234